MEYMESFVKKHQCWWSWSANALSFQLPQDQTQDFHELFRDLPKGLSNAEMLIDVVWFCHFWFAINCDLRHRENDVTVSAKLASLLPSLPPSSVFSDLSFSSWQDVQVQVVLHPFPPQANSAQTLSSDLSNAMPVTAFCTCILNTEETTLGKLWRHSQTTQLSHTSDTSNLICHWKRPKKIGIPFRLPVGSN